MKDIFDMYHILKWQIKKFSFKFFIEKFVNTQPIIFEEIEIFQIFSLSYYGVN